MALQAFYIVFDRVHAEFISFFFDFLCFNISVPNCKKKYFSYFLLEIILFRVSCQFRLRIL